MILNNQGCWGTVGVEIRELARASSAGEASAQRELPAHLANSRLRPQFLPDLAHLLASVFERPAVVDDEIRDFDLLFVRKLRRHPACNLSSRRLKIYVLPSAKSPGALLRPAGHHDQPVEALQGARFDEQCRFHHGDTMRILEADGVHPLVLAA